MSEFYFSYRCIAPDGTDVTYREDAPRLMLFTAGKCVDSPDIYIRVPRVLREKYAAMAVYHIKDGVDFPDLSASPARVAAWARDGVSSDDSLTSEPYAYLRFGEGDVGGGVGAAAFLSAPDAPVDRAHTYRFSYDLAHKCVVTYRIDEREDGIDVRAIYPYLHGDVSLRVLSGEGAKPLTAKDVYRSDYALRRGNESVTLVLRNRNRPADVTDVLHIAAPDTKSRDFRLAFADPEDGKRIVLADASQDTLEDSRARKEARKKQGKKRKARTHADITVLGMPKAGKTTYILSLGSCQWKEQTNVWQAQTQCYLPRMASAWPQSHPRKAFLGVHYPEAYAESDRSGVLPRTTADAATKICTYYAVSKAQYIKRGLRPRKTMSLYDTAGDALEGNRFDPAWHTRDGILLCIDPTRGAKAAADELKMILDNLAIVNKQGAKWYETPIAVVFTKLDMLLGERVSRDGDPEQCFDGNCHVAQEDARDLYPRNGVYAGSAVERHIDAVDYELTHFLYSGGESAREKITACKRTFANLKLFACSALGYADVYGDEGEKRTMPFAPIATELPLLWLGYATGLIRR